MKSENFVYHYTKMETAILILRDMTLRMGCLEKVNDPKESTNRNFKFYLRDNRTSLFFQKDIFDDLERDLTHNTFALCCVGSGAIKDNNQHENAMLPNLWAYYGENHNGACMVLNKKKLNEKIVEATNNNLLQSEKIRYLEHEEWALEVYSAYSIYLEDLLSDKNGYFDDHVKNNFMELFFTKQKAWRDELEFRWVVRSREDRGYINIDLTGCLELVVVGSSAPEKFEEEISILCARANCAQHKANWRTSGGYHKARTREPHLDLNGISYSTDVASASVVIKGIDENGACQPLIINFSNGTLCLLESKGSDELNIKKRAEDLSIELTDCDAAQNYKPVFSASRLEKSPRKPLKIIINNGEVSPAHDEEQQYHKDGFTYKPR